MKKGGKIVKINPLHTEEFCNNFIKDLISIKQFKKDHYDVFRAIEVGGWTYMFDKIKENRYNSEHWDHEKCKKFIEDNKYENLIDLKDKNQYLYHMLYKMKHTDLITSLKVKPNMNPPDYWTYDRCKEAVDACETLPELLEKFGGAHNAIRKKKYTDLKDILKVRFTKPRGYWDSKENCKEEVLKYTSIEEFKNGNKWVYELILSRNWDELLIPIKVRFGQKPGYWTKERCREEALKYTSKKFFGKECKPVYAAVLRNKADGWMEYVCGHMDNIQRPNGFWNYETCKEYVNKHTKLNEFRREYSGAIHAIKREGWDELLDHLELYGNSGDRLLYAYFFPDNSVYIGLTCEPTARKCKHANSTDSTVYKYRESTKTIPQYIELTDYMNEFEAAKLEGELIEKYRNEGYNILNKAKAGGLGGNPGKDWSYEYCKSLAEGAKNRSEFHSISSTAYQVSYNNGWIDEFFPKK
jgi:hypothetical protein